MSRFLDTKRLIHLGDFNYLCAQKGLSGKGIKPVYRINTHSKTAATWPIYEREDFFDQSNHPLNEWGQTSSGGFPLYTRYQEYSAFLIYAGQRRRLASYEKRAHIAYLTYDLVRASNNTALLSCLSDELDGIDLSEYLDDINRVGGADLGLPQVTGDAEDKLMAAMNAFMQIQARENPGYFSLDPVPMEYFRDFHRQYFGMAWDLSGIEKKWKGHLPGGTTSSLKRDAWGIFQPYALKLKERESIRSSATLLQSACLEIERFLKYPGREGLSLETQWELYAEVIIQARYLYYWNKAVRGGQASERDFLYNTLPPVRLCRYCGDAFTQARGYKISFRCHEHACKNTEDRRYMKRRRELQAAGKPATDIRDY